MLVDMHSVINSSVSNSLMLLIAKMIARFHFTRWLRKMGRTKDTGFVFFFFFQAEDGIRDYKVTGVQTCALPICLVTVWVILQRQAQAPGSWMRVGRGERRTVETKAWGGRFNQPTHDLVEHFTASDRKSVV